MKKIIITTALLAAFCSFSYGQAEYQDFDKVSTVAGQYLNINAGAAAAGMADAYLGMAKDAAAMYWNPAGLNNMKNEGKDWNFFFSQNIWFMDMGTSNVAVAKHVKKAGVFGASISYFNAGEIERADIDSNGDPIEREDTYTPYSIVLSGGYSNTMDKNLDYGITIRYLLENIDGDTASAYAVDIGARYMFPYLPGLSFNIVAKNFGGVLNGFTLAKELDFSAAYTRKIQDFTVSVDYDICGKINNYPIQRIGAEIELPYMFVIRGGYRTDNTTIEEGLKNFNFGIGLNIADKYVDFAFEPYGSLGNAYKVSFGGDF